MVTKRTIKKWSRMGCRFCQCSPEDIHCTCICHEGELLEAERREKKKTKKVS